MPMIFPTSPTLGQVFTEGGRSWVWTGATWDSPTATNTLLAPYGLEFIKSQTIGTGVTTVVVNNAFSATYDEYLITINGGVNPSGGANIGLQLGATTSGYSFAGFRAALNSVSLTAEGATSQPNVPRVARTGLNGYSSEIRVTRPFNSSPTSVIAESTHFDVTDQICYQHGLLSNTTSYTDFTLILNFGTLTGGTINVYGFRKL
jgi:hypothetical protein